MSNHASPTSWPAGRGISQNVKAKFGQDHHDLAQWALGVGDPLADAVVTEMHSDQPGVAVMLRDGIVGGLASLSDPTPGIAALLGDAEREPDFVVGDFYEAGPAPFYTTPGPVHLVSLSAGALVRVYESPSIALVLATTGRLLDGAESRILETGKWLETIMLPGALRRGEPGYVAILQVRMLHAHVRRLAGQKGFDEATHGVPINQVDLARTWMDFTLTSFMAENVMGFDLSEDEQATLYSYWHLVAHLLGLDPRMIAGVTGNETAQRLNDLFQAVTGPPVAESAALAQATIDSIAHLLHEALPIPEGMAAHALRALTRQFHGDRVADALGIEKSEIADVLISEAVHGVRFLRAHRRKDAKAWAADQVKNLAEVREQLAKSSDATEYERHAKDERPR